MNLLFVENRYATWISEAVAKELGTDGHAIHWIIQNPRFKPRLGTSHVLPFPKAGLELVADEWENALARVAASDRQILHFGGNDRHYPHYVREIEAILDRTKPDVVFGESTQFHELITIEACRRRHIPYLFPITLGYPPGRISFFAYDTRSPVGGDGSHLACFAAIEMIDAINKRQRLPSYMNTPAIGGVTRHWRSFTDRALITLGWLGGERFATPSPIRKITVDRMHKRARGIWDQIARERSVGTRPYVLYALQLQPECAIDVWGQPWSDQANVIERAAKALESKGMALLVKPNPRSKYEMSKVLCDMVAHSPNAVPVVHGTPMQDVVRSAVGVLGVTGTVLLEAVFAGKPAISLGTHALSRYPGIVQVTTPEQVGDAIHSATGSTSQSPETAVRLLKWLHSVSYPGDVFEPLFDRKKLTSELIDQNRAAFRDVITRIANKSLVIDPWIGRPEALQHSSDVRCVLNG